MKYSELYIFGKYLKGYKSGEFIIVSATKRKRDIKIPLCLSAPHAEKFNIVSNDHGRTHKCDFSVSGREYLFWASLVEDIKIVSLS